MSYFTREQVNLLLKPIHPKRVLMREGMSYVEGYDIKAELNRVFGFGRWSVDLLGQSLVAETATKTRNGKDAWYVVYRTSLRLTISDPDGATVCHYDESHVGESTHPVRGEAHGNALTNSWTYALKRCASSLGDQFGLSLYGKGSMDALVRWTLVRPEAPEGSVNDDDVPQVTAETTETSGTEPPARTADAAAGQADHGHATRPLTPSLSTPDGEVDEAAQPFADEAAQATTVRALQPIHARAREAHKLASLIRSPATGNTGGLGQYLNWRRTVLAKADAALAALQAQGQRLGLSADELDAEVTKQVGRSLEAASVEDMEKVTAVLAGIEMTSAVA
jgi:Rad52/22 family double-strand break repair protein